MTSVLVTAAEKLGRRHGSEKGSWVIDGNTKKEAAERLIKGHEDGDPQVMDLCPNPLSGEWTDEPLEMEILGEIANLAAEMKPDKVEPVHDDNLLDVYESHFQEGFWDTVIQAAKNV